MWLAIPPAVRHCVATAERLQWDMICQDARWWCWYLVKVFLHHVSCFSLHFVLLCCFSLEFYACVLNLGAPGRMQKEFNDLCNPETIQVMVFALFTNGCHLDVDGLQVPLLPLEFARGLLCRLHLVDFECRRKLAWGDTTTQTPF